MIENTSVHGGRIKEYARISGLLEKDIIDFSANINPFGTLTGLETSLVKVFHAIDTYPDTDTRDLIKAASDNLQISPNEILFGNGEDELFFYTLFSLKQKNVLISDISYSTYKKAALNTKKEVHFYKMLHENKFVFPVQEIENKLKELNEDCVVIIARPNNPDGSFVSSNDIKHLATSFPKAVFIIDEAFIEFTEYSNEYKSFYNFKNIIILRSLTKMYAIPGLRLGYALAHKENIENIKALLPDWNINCFANYAGLEIFTHGKDFAFETRKEISLLRENLVKKLEDLKAFTVFPSNANYVLVKYSGILKPNDLYDGLVKLGTPIRSCANYAGLDSAYFRIAVKKEKETNILLKNICALLNIEDKNKLATKKRAKALMIQGLSSGAGKSLIAAAFCRILTQDGYKTAPYKAQNMSLNARVCFDGGEIGVAQWLQAKACKCEPSVLMNPVLLKPTSDVGSKVILLGKPYGTAGAVDYGAMTKELRVKAREAYDILAEENEVIVLEGAGSPCEINLKQRDFVNMNAALYADAQVLLVGDIDTGGVFADFIGHVACFNTEEKKLVAGFLVNKFRGDAALLGNAYDLTEKYTGIKVLGTIPYVHTLTLPEEDGTVKTIGNPASPIKIAVIRFMHIANAQDFDAFHEEVDIYVEFVKTLDELKSRVWDIIILPGSRSSIADLNSIEVSGIAAYCLAYAKAGGLLFGVCGGMQMLGYFISDSLCVETEKPTAKNGLGLLEIETVFKNEKIQKNTMAFCGGIQVSGYQIRHGVSSLISGASETKNYIIDINEINNVSNTNDTAVIGFINKNICGTYLHGVFDTPSFRDFILNPIREKKNLKLGTKENIKTLDAQLDELAAVVRKNVDLKTIYKAMGLV